MSCELEKRPERLFPLWPKQIEFVDATERIKGFVAGQGAGKTRVGAWELLEKSRTGRLYIVTASTYKMLRDATGRTFTEVARQADRLVKPIGGEDLSAIILAGDKKGTAEVIFRSTDNPDNLRGPTCSGVWMDEASYSPYEAYQVLVARLRERGEMGWLIATFTPNGLTHWTYDIFGKGSEGHHLTQAATHENPFINEELIAELEQTYVGARAEQELGGQFVAMEGCEFDSRWFHDGIWFDEWPKALPLKCISLDPSKGRTDKPSDYQAFTLLGLDKSGILWCDADISRRKGPEMVDVGLNLFNEFNPNAFAVESNNTMGLLSKEFMRVARERLRLVFPLFEIYSRVPKPVRIRSLAPILAQNRIRFKRSKGAELLVQQLRDWPQGSHDDGPDSLEQAVCMMTYLMGKQPLHAMPKAVEG